MPWKTGNVGTFANKAITTDETIGTGDGSNLNFTYQLSKYALFRETLVIKYTVGTVLYTATCTSGGVISGTYIASGSCTEEGYISLTFSTAPDNGTLVYADSYTTKGVLQCILDFVCGTKYSENLGTGNGSTTTFSVTLSNTPIALGQCRVRYKIAGVEYDAWDNGEGKIAGTLIDSDNSPINNSSGALTVKFNTAPDDGYVMVVSYVVSSTEGRDWMILRETTTKTAAGADAFSGLLLKECILKNSGVSYKDMFCIGLREYQYISTQLWGINLNLYHQWNSIYEGFNSWNCNSSWSGKTTYNTTYNNYTAHPSTYLKDDVMKYWVISNKRRIIVIMKVSNTVYASLYAGGIKRIMTSEEYPIPAYVSGNYWSNVNFSNTSLRSIHDVEAGLNYFKSFAIATNGNILPATGGKLNNGQFFTNTATLKKNSDNTVSLFPLFLVDETVSNPDSTLLGEVDGVFLCPCNDIIVEDIIQYSGVDYLVVQDIYRTSYSDYYAVALE